MNNKLAIFIYALIILAALLLGALPANAGKGENVYLPMIMSNDQPTTPDYDVECHLAESGDNELEIDCQGSQEFLSYRDDGTLVFQLHDNGMFDMAGCLQWGICNDGDSSVMYITPFDYPLQWLYLSQTPGAQGYGNSLILYDAKTNYKVYLGKPKLFITVWEDGSFEGYGCLSWGNCQLTYGDG